MFLLVNILESFLGTHRKHNEDTGQISFDCPVCSANNGYLEGDGKGNLEINYDLNVYKCWVCAETNNTHGSVIKLLKKYGTPKNLRDYLLVKPDADILKEREREYTPVTLPETFKKFSDCSSKDYKYDIAIKYLYDRGITDEIINFYGIGYTTYGTFANRIIIPSYDSDNQLNYFIARWFPDEYTKLKYLNPDAEKQEIIFNESKINWDSTIYLVEGVFDSIVIPNSIPLLGKYINDKLLDMLYDNAKANIVIVLDDDAKKDAIKLYEKLNFGDLYGRIKICFPPEGYDPSLLFQKYKDKGILILLKSSRQPTKSELN